MRHQISGKRLGRDSGQRAGLRRTLINQLIEHERIETVRGAGYRFRGA